MADQHIILPSKPKVVSEDGFTGVYEIDGLYPGYGHTLGNSLRRIILSSLPGAAITSVKINGVNHEFSTIEGVREDVIAIMLQLKRVRVHISSDEPQSLKLKVSKAGEIKASDIEISGQVEILNPELVIAHIENKGSLDIEMTAEKGIGYVSKEVIQKNRVEIGSVALDAIFTPIRRVNYEVENMRVGDRTDFNRLKFFVETDGTITPHEALEKSIEIMIHQLKAIVGFKEEEPAQKEEVNANVEPIEEKKADETEIMKTRIENLPLSARTQNALARANIRTVGGLARKAENDLLEVEGLGDKGLQEIRRALSEYGIILK
jgi:DNA-directed RNA polymerase subunit alpha